MLIVDERRVSEIYFRPLIAAALDAQHFSRVFGRLGLQHLVDDRAVPDAEQRADQSRVRAAVVAVAAALVLRRVVTGYLVTGRRRARRAGRPPFVMMMMMVMSSVLAAAVLFGYMPDHAVLEREPSLARQARERLLLGVGAHVPAQVLGRVETV